jgi:hypothetical protein
MASTGAPSRLIRPNGLHEIEEAFELAFRGVRNVRLGGIQVLRDVHHRMSLRRTRRWCGMNRIVQRVVHAKRKCVHRIGQPGETEVEAGRLLPLRLATST